MTGSATVCGREGLRSYWSTGLARSPELHFDLHTVFCGTDSVILGYRNHRGRDVAELTELSEEGSGRAWCRSLLAGGLLTRAAATDRRSCSEWPCA